MTPTRLVTNCSCDDSSHIMEFILEDNNDRAWDTDDPELYIAVQLNPQFGFWRRCWIALSYIRGKRSRFGSGHWDCGSLTPLSAHDLGEMLRKFLDAYEQKRKSKPYTAVSGTTGVY